MPIIVAWHTRTQLGWYSLCTSFPTMLLDPAEKTILTFYENIPHVFLYPSLFLCQTLISRYLTVLYSIQLLWRGPVISPGLPFRLHFLCLWLDSALLHPLPAPKVNRAASLLRSRVSVYLHKSTHTLTLTADLSQAPPCPHHRRLGFVVQSFSFFPPLLLFFFLLHSLYLLPNPRLS